TGNDIPRGELGSLTTTKVGKRLGGASHRSPLPSARTRKMPSPRGGGGVRLGYTENCLVISKTTPDASGSTANRWKTPPTMAYAPLRASPKTPHKRRVESYTGVDEGVSMTVTGSQFPRRTMSFCFTEVRSCGSLVHSVTT